ncbi:hypothetical protein INT46_010419 [Mucor plumbeus]|uniref:Uncharacterized protein n=1 Tax=Mucor plumbeus TaxID=97098 RepID=A0A8H7QU56_9FUNG|nr:hypothetical protein INT46_010419 [Mucor plumbeus]
MDPIPVIPSPTIRLPKSNHHRYAHHDKPTTISIEIPMITDVNKENIYTPAKATTERIPTTTWGSFTIVVVVFLITLTCFILNCSRIRRKVNETRMDKLGKSGLLSFERRHNKLQEADLEWNNHPPMVFTTEKLLTTPESTYSSKHSSSSSSSSSSAWSSTNSTIAQKHHYNDKNFIKNQPPSVQLRLTLENASNSLYISAEPKRPKILSRQQHFVSTSNQL